MHVCANEIFDLALTGLLRRLNAGPRRRLGPDCFRFLGGEATAVVGVHCSMYSFVTQEHRQLRLGPSACALDRATITHPRLVEAGTT